MDIPYLLFPSLFSCRLGYSVQISLQVLLARTSDPKPWLVEMKTVKEKMRIVRADDE
jgi:hypothetical protein